MTPLDSQIPDTVDLLLTIVSLVVSAVAFYKSDSAKKAVAKALDHRDAQDDLDRITNLVADLKAAKDSVTPWIPEIADRQAGRDRKTDLAMLHNAVDSLRTNPLLEVDMDLRGGIDEAANRLSDLAGQIGENPSNGVLWKSAQSELQWLIRSLEKAKRVMKKKLIAGR